MICMDPYTLSTDPLGACVPRLRTYALITCSVCIFIIEGGKSCSCSIEYLIILKSLVILLNEENDIAYLKHIMPFVDF